MNDHIILCGLGKVGFSILELLRSQGESVVVVTRDVAPDWAQRAQTLASRLILADARHDEVLLEADIQRARALIIATNEDLVNLEIALDARRIAPEVAIVVRLYDLQLAERVRRDLGVRAVLNAAELSAPAFVAAALGEHVLRAFDVETAFITILTLRITGEATGAGGTLGELTARLNVIPLAVRAGAVNHTLSPSLHSVLAAGDEIIVAASRPALEALQRNRDFAFGHAHRGPSRPRRRGRPRAWTRPRLHLLALIQRIWKHASSALRAAFLAFHLLVLVGVTLFHFALNLKWLDALYFTITIMTTVGFGDIHLLEAPAWVKLFGILLMISGVAFLVIFFGIITDYLVSQRFEQALGRPRTTLSNHVVVVGLGRVGQQTALRLHELGEPVLAIERNAESDFASRLPEEIPVLIGDANQPQLMEQAGMERARAVVAVTDDDMVNLRVAHNAESLNPRVRTVVRLFHSSLANKLGPSILAIDQAVNPSQAAAATFAACALAPDVLQGFTLGPRLLMLRWLDVRQAPQTVHQSVGNLREDHGILVLLRRPSGEARLHDVAPDDVIQEGDRLVVLEEYRPEERAPASCSLVLFREPVPNV